jgi:glycosyltransferase involved in cell wall biosynthesis
MPDAATVPPPPPDVRPPDARPLVVFVCDSLPPYRVRVHRRAIAEIPGVRFHTVVTHDPQAGGAWEPVPQSVVPHEAFGEGESPLRRGRLAAARAEWRKGGRIVRWLAANRPAAVVVNGYNDPGRLRILRWCGRRGVPAFCWADSNVKADLARGAKAVVKRRLVGWVVRTCFGVMPFGSLGAAYFARYGAKHDRTFLVPMEPDYDRIADLPPERVADARRAHGLDPARRRLVYCGRLVPEKRVDLALAAFAAVAAERPDWDLLVVGDGPLREDLRKAVPPELADRVIWAGAVRESERVFALQAACDVLVLPSDYEPWALVVNEAAAGGLAVVCSDVVGAAAELVRDRVNGAVFPRGDAAALAAALWRVTDPARLPAMKAASRRVLADWRKAGDPVAGIRRALSACGALSERRQSGDRPQG